MGCFMTDKPFPQRKSPRLKDYDYSQSGAYFITICTHQRQHLFGTVADEKTHLSSLGELALWHWDDLINHFPHIVLDAFVVMPNHIHGIIFVLDTPPTDGIDAVPTVQKPSKRPTLGTLVGTYKAAVSRNVRQKLQLTAPIWQGRYHDHIIRSEERLNFIRQYVELNPAKWAEDRYFK
jgi:putative transposase